MSTNSSPVTNPCDASRFARNPSAVSSLTKREMDVYCLMLQGLALKAVASELGLSPKTVSVHKQRITKKLGLENAVQFVLHGIKAGLIKPM